MWSLITDCSKQLTINSKLRENLENRIKEYEIVEVEFDQFKLDLIAQDGLPPADPYQIVLACNQIVEYRFEVEITEI